MRYGRTSGLKYLRIWKCLAYLRKTKIDKLDARATMSYFEGYPIDSMGYELYIPKDNRIDIRYHTQFLEKEFVRERGVSRIIVLKKVERAEQNSKPIMHILDQKEPFKMQLVQQSGRISRAPEGYGYVLKDGQDSFIMGDNDMKMLLLPMIKQ